MGSMAFSKIANGTIGAPDAPIRTIVHFSPAVNAPAPLLLIARPLFLC